MNCLLMAGTCSALLKSWRAGRAMLMGHGEVDFATREARARVGCLPVEGRYRRLPRRLGDDYELPEGEVLGSGFNGAVVMARCRRRGTLHAVKSLSTEGLNASAKEMLASELGVYLSMDHPHVARLMAVYESEKEISMVMECCAGGELCDRVEAQKVFTEGEASHATWQMLLAISYLHTEGVVHRDLKLENFLYEQKGGNFLKIIDFGFSKFYQESTEMRERCGTVFYIAPEVLDGSYLGGSCDMWSLGVIVFVLLAGYMPFDGDSDKDILQAVRSGTFVMHESCWSHISESAKDFVKRLLVREPSDRMTAQQAMRHPWLAEHSDVSLGTADHCLTSAAMTLDASDVPEAFLSFSRATRFQQVCMQMMAWTLPLEERRLLRNMFLELDRSHTGVLLLSQLDQLLSEKYHMPKLVCEAVCKAMARLDADQDGELHYSDFLAVMMVPRLRQGDCNAAEEAFWRFDVKGLGYLTEDGLRRTLEEDVSAYELQHAFRLLDVDNDGKIYVKDFVSHLCEALAASSSPCEPGDDIDGRFSCARV